MSVDEYLETEPTSDFKREFFHGEVFAMTGASITHNMIASNMFLSLGSALRGKDCFIFSSDMRVELDEAKHFVYPDISIVCGAVEKTKGRNDTITNPKVVVEVLSDSTKDYDRGSKFKAYRNLPSLTDYVIVDQKTTSVEHHRKQAEGRWIMCEYERREDSLVIEDLEIVVPLSEIYYRVNVEVA